MAFIESEDFYYDENGQMVLTASYLLRRGHCCHSDCRHCPYQIDDKACDIPPEFNLGLKEDPYDKYIELADQDCDDSDN